MMKVFYYDCDEGFDVYVSVLHPFFDKYDPELVFYAYEFSVCDDAREFLGKIAPYIENELNYRLANSEDEFYELTGLRIV